MVKNTQINIISSTDLDLKEPIEELIHIFIQLQKEVDELKADVKKLKSEKNESNCSKPL